MAEQHFDVITGEELCNCCGLDYLCCFCGFHEGECNSQWKEGEHAWKDD